MRLLYDIVMAQGQRLDQHHELLQDHGALLETHQKQIIDFERTSRYYVGTLMSFLNQQEQIKCFPINLWGTLTIPETSQLLQSSHISGKNRCYEYPSNLGQLL